MSPGAGGDGDGDETGNDPPTNEEEGEGVAKPLSETQTPASPPLPPPGAVALAEVNCVAGASGPVVMHPKMAVGPPR